MASRISFAWFSKRFAPLRRFFRTVWRRYRGLAIWLQAVIAVALVIALLALGSWLSHLGSSAESDASIPTVALSPISELAGTSSSVGVIGTVRSVTEADLLAQSGGTVTSVHTHLGASVPAGFVIAELDNAGQRAAVLQAEGVYESALAAQAGASPKDIGASALNTYVSSYNSLDSTLKTYVDQFYGDTGAFGPQFLIGPSPFDSAYFPKKRAALASAMDAWRAHVSSANSSNAQALLEEADTDARQAAALITDIATAATKHDTDASAAQLAALATARANIATIQAGITAAKQSYQSQGTSATAGAAASVKTALGALRAAEANLEKTVIRAPIAGQVNFLPLHVGDYVTALSHVATVAQNGALEIVAYVSEDNRALLSAGTKVTVEGGYEGVVTSIAPALDPVTKQIEVHVAVNGQTKLVNGQSVRIGLPNAAATSVATSSGPILLPLAALKLTPSARVVFTIGADGTLVAHPVDIGEVRGDRIEILTPLPADLRIVTDARGLSEGQKVNVAAIP